MIKQRTKTKHASCSEKKTNFKTTATIMNPDATRQAAAAHTPHVPPVLTPPRSEEHTSELQSQRN